MQPSCLFTLSNFLAVPFVSGSLFAFKLLQREQCQRHSVGETPTLGSSGAWAAPLPCTLFPLWVRLDMLWGALHTWARGKCSSPADLQRITHKEFTCLDCQSSVYFPLQSLGSKQFFYCLPSLHSTEASVKHPCHHGSQGSPGLPSLLVRRGRRLIRKLKYLTCLSNKIIHGRWVAEQHFARLLWIIHNMVSAGTGVLL